MPFPRARHASPHALVLVVLVVSLALTTGATLLAAAYARDQALAKFDRDAALLEVRVRNRINAYQEVLLGGKALMAVEPNVTRAEWDRYVDTLDLATHFPGIQGLGWAVIIAPEDLAAHEAAVRAEGFPDYAVTPAGPRETYTSIVFLEPFAGRNLRAFGFDMYSEPVRREAMARARDTASPALSGRVTLVQENGTDEQYGFLMYVPVYRQGALDSSQDERREAIVGWVYSPFRAKDLLRGILPDNTVDLSFQLYAGRGEQPEQLLYDSATVDGPGVARGDGPTRVRELNFESGTLTLRETGVRGSVPTSTRLLPIATALMGLVMTGLIVGIVMAMGRTQARAEALATQMTRELRASNDALQAFTYVVSHDLKEPVRGIDAYLAILREDHASELSPEARHLVGRAHEANARLSALLTSLLDLSRLDRERLLLVDVSVEDALAAPSCRLAFERLASERSALVEADAHMRVHASVPILAQALGNLVANAIRHGAAEGPRVRVSARAIEGAVEVSVEDNGLGYSNEIIVAFNRGQAAPHGFGLVIAQRAIERLGGRMWLDRSSALGGAAARFVLPAAQAPREER